MAGAFERFVSHITRQYVGHVLGLVKSYWPTTRLDALGRGAKADCTDDQFRQYLAKTSGVANQIVEALSKQSLLKLFLYLSWRVSQKYFEQMLDVCVKSSTC